MAGASYTGLRVSFNNDKSPFSNVCSPTNVKLGKFIRKFFFFFFTKGSVQQHTFKERCAHLLRHLISIYSLGFIKAIIFSNLMARVISPLIFSFPDMKAIVGFIFPVERKQLLSILLTLNAPSKCYPSNRYSTLSSLKKILKTQLFQESQLHIQCTYFTERHHFCSSRGKVNQYFLSGSPVNILMKSALSMLMRTSALTGGSPLPALPASVFRSMYQTPGCSP